jgi:hypothetical protein
MRIKQLIFNKSSELVEQKIAASLNTLKLVNAELTKETKQSADVEMHKSRDEIIHSEEEEKKPAGKRSTRPQKSRVIESSSGSEITLGLKMKADEDSEVVNFEINQRSKGARLTMSAAQSAPVSAD